MTEEELQWGDFMAEIAGRHIKGDHSCCHPRTCEEAEFCIRVLEAFTKIVEGELNS